MNKNRTVTLSARAVSVFATLVALALVISCSNPAGPDPDPGTGTEVFANFTFRAEDLVKDTATTAAGAAAGTFSTEHGAGTVTYQLVNGDGSFDNDRFTVDGGRLVIGDSALTAEKEYRIRARAVDEAGGSLEEAFTVEVFGTSGSPRGITVVAGQRTLYLSWNRTGGAEAYRVAWSTASNFASPTYIGTDFTVPEAEITGLDDATQYYVQVRAKFPGGVLSNWSGTRPADTPTGDPIDAYWYTGNYSHLTGGVMYPDQTTEYHETAEDARTGWDSETDCYYFIPQADDSGVRMVYGAPGVAIPGEDSMIFYHKRFPAALAEAAAPHTMLGKGGDALRMADNVTKPDAGVFIYKHFNTLTQKWVYYATYYHGLGAIARAQSFGIVNHQYTITQYLGNGAAGAFDPANAGYPMPPRPAHVTFYSPDLVHAKKNYTMAYMNYHIAWVAVPWYLRNLAWLGNNTVAGGHRADGWLGNIPGDLTVVQ